MDGHHANTSDRHEDKFYYHRDPWVEIWDRNRSEITIDEMGDRALATAKVRNGKIEKVIVLKSGRGYIDPVAYAWRGPLLILLLDTMTMITSIDISI